MRTGNKIFKLIGVFVVFGAALQLLPRLVFAEVEPAAARRIEQQINIIDQEAQTTSPGTSTGTDGRLGIFHYDADDYGSHQIFFEAVIMNEGTATTSAHILKFPGLAEPANSAVSTADTSYVRACNGTDGSCNDRTPVSLVDDSDYIVSLETTSAIATNEAFIQAARLIIVQSTSDFFPNTETQVEIGYSGSTKSTSYTSDVGGDGNFHEKYWKYEPDKYDGVSDISFQATLKRSGDAGADTVVAGLFEKGSAAPLSEVELIATQAETGDTGVFTLKSKSLSSLDPFPLTANTEYLVKIKATDPGTVDGDAFIANAKIVISQDGFTKFQTFQMYNNRVITADGATRNFNQFEPSNFDKTDWQTHFEATAKTGGGTGDLELGECGNAESVITFPGTTLLLKRNTNIGNLAQTELDVCLTNLVANSSWLVLDVTIPNPNAPSNFRDIGLTETTITWAWNDNSDDEEGFQVAVSDNSELANEDCRDLPPNTTSCVEGGLDEDHLYSRHVYAERESSLSNFSNIDSAVTLPDGPTGPASAIPGHNQTDNFFLDVSWTAPNADDYTTFSVNRFQDTDCSSAFSTPLSDTVNSSIRDRNLDSGTTYCYRIRSQNLVGVENTAEQVFVAGTTISDTTPPTLFEPQDPSNSELLSSARMTFTWTASSDDFELANYKVFVDDGEIGEVDGATTSLTIDIAVSDGRHSWYVLAIDTSGNTTRSGTETFVLDTIGPDEPTNLRAYGNTGKRDILISGIGNSSTSPYFEWDEAHDATSGVDGYFVYFGTDSRANPVSNGQFVTSENFSSSIAFLNTNFILPGLAAYAAEPGDYFLRIVAKDRAGHTSGTWEAFNYRYDPTAGGAVANALGNLGQILEKSGAARATALAVPAAVIALELPNLYAFFIYLFQLVTSFFTKLRKRKFWGVVYDSVTKQPVPLALVRLTGPTTQLAVTDREGRYGFVIDAGTYELKIKKQGYTFPTVSIVGEKDGEYAPLYTGGAFGVQEGREELVDLHVPLDPVNLTEQRRKLLTADGLREALFIPLVLLNIAGLAVNWILYLRTNSIFYVIFGGLYAALLLLNLKRLADKFFKAKPRFGIVRDFLSNEPMEGVTVRLIDKATNANISARRTSKSGKFAFFLRRTGDFILQGEKEGYVFEPFEVSVEDTKSPYIAGELIGKKQLPHIPPAFPAAVSPAV